MEQKWSVIIHFKDKTLTSEMGNSEYQRLMQQFASPDVPVIKLTVFMDNGTSERPPKTGHLAIALPQVLVIIGETIN